MERTFLILFAVLSRLPLALLHAAGAALGWLAFALSGSYRQRLHANAVQAGVAWPDARASVAHAGRMVAELPRLWLGSVPHSPWLNGHLVQAALDQAPTRGLLFLTPHMGAFDQAARSYAENFGHQQPVTVLYRPPRQTYLHGLMFRSRQRPGMRAVPTDLSGVKAMLKALRSGGTVGLLPDQVPPDSMGEWADFFGQPAYTMSLVARLIAQTQPTVLWVFAERLSWGHGYQVHVFESDLSQSDVAQSGNAAVLAKMNAELQSVVRQCPQQYLWGYNRYKQPAAATGSKP